jgi:hypothetical protein
MCKNISNVGLLRIGQDFSESVDCGKLMFYEGCDKGSCTTASSVSIEQRVPKL